MKSSNNDTEVTKDIESKPLIIGLILTTLLCLACWYNNTLGSSYVPVPVLAVGGIIATFMWAIRSSTTVDEKE